MSKSIKYFVGNWKMFGIPGSFKITNKINSFFRKDKKNNKNYKIFIALPYTLLQSFSKIYRKSKIGISAQNCFHEDNFGAYTGSISPFMIKKLGVKNIIIGHSENRLTGDNDKVIKKKLFLALKNNLNVIFCIGENKLEKKQKKTMIVLKRQISNAFKKNYNFKKIIFAYEPIWSIGTGKVPSKTELKANSSSLKKFIRKKFKIKNNPKLLYGGSVDSKSIKEFKSINELDGFLIGGASKSAKNFIDIIKNFYK